MPLIRNGNIESILKFNPMKSFYFFVAIKRKKDNPDLQMKKSEMIKSWIIKDERDFYFYYITQMLDVVSKNNCRLYMCTDRKSYAKTMLSIRKDIDAYLDSAIENDTVEYSPRMLVNLLPSNAMKAESSDKKERKWLFDIDVKDKKVVEVIKKLCGESFEIALNTKNGYHVIAKRQFDATLYLTCILEGKVKTLFGENKFTNEEIKLIQDNKDNISLKDNAMALIAMDY